MKQVIAGAVVGSAVTILAAALLGAGPDVERPDAAIGRFQISTGNGGVWLVDTTNGHVSYRTNREEDKWEDRRSPVPGVTP